MFESYLPDLRLENFLPWTLEAQTLELYWLTLAQTKSNYKIQSLEIEMNLLQVQKFSSSFQIYHGFSSLCNKQRDHGGNRRLAI